MTGWGRESIFGSMGLSGRTTGHEKWRSDPRKGSNDRPFSAPLSTLGSALIYWTQQIQIFLRNFMPDFSGSHSVLAAPCPETPPRLIAAGVMWRCGVWIARWSIGLWLS